MRVVVIGGGPAGVAAALHAAELGAAVMLAERGRLGGTALGIRPQPHLWSSLSSTPSVPE